MTNPSGGTLASVLREHSDDILDRWAARLRGQHPGFEELTSEAMLNRLPEWLSRLADRLEHLEHLDDKAPIAPEVSRSHGQLRFIQNIPLGVLIQEYIALRETMLTCLREHQALSEAQQTLVACCADRALVEAAQAFVRESGQVEGSQFKQTRVSDERFRIALRAGSVAVFEQDVGLIYTSEYPDCATFGQYIVGQSDADVLPPPQAEPLMAFKRQVMQSGHSAEREFKLSPRGETRYFRVNVVPRLDDRQRVAGLITTLVDVTEPREAQASLQAQKDQTEHILNIANVGLWTWNPENDTAYLSPQAKAQLGYDDDEIGDSPLAWHTLILNEDRYWVKQLLDDVVNFRKEHYQAEFRARHKDGSLRWILSRGGWWPPDDNRDAWLLVGINIDISNRKAVEKALLKEKRRAQVTLDSISEGVITTDAQGIVQQMNPAAESGIGWSEQQATGQHCRQIFQVVDDRDGRRLESPIMECLRTNKTVARKFHTRLLTRNGSSHPVAYSVSPILDPDGGVSGAVLVYFDVSEERRLLREMTHQASHDELTGLANRREFESRLAQTVGQVGTTGSEAALMFIDLDRFKAINDTCGHAAGDRLLKDLAKQLQEPIRDRDILARIGGDEFAVVLEHCSLENARDIALQLRERVRQYRFTCGGHSFVLGASIGIAAIDQSADDSGTFVARADSACNRAKTKGRNRVEVYQPSEPESERERALKGWLPALRQALEADSFRLFRQPFEPVLAAVEGSDALYFEILLRFKDEQGAIIPAQSFISAAERHELMPSVDMWVVQHTLDWLAANPGISERLTLCCINLSAALLANESAHSALLGLLDQWAIQPRKLCFELDESDLGTHLAAASPLIRQIRALGYRFALDHFGRGMSSFDLLKELPFDFVKIDRRYVERVATDSYDLAIVRSINEMSHSMGLQTIAEGVNSVETKQYLASIGVDFMQGFSVGRPQDVTTATPAE